MDRNCMNRDQNAGLWQKANKSNKEQRYVSWL